MILFESLNRISFFSILAWGFYLIAVLCAIILTTLSSPLARKYRKTLIATGTSSIMLGTLAWSTPFFIRRLNPDQSRLTAIDQLTPTEWLEPVSNPETELSSDEIAWTKSLQYRFKFKIQFKDEFVKAVAVEGSTLVMLDQTGALRGLNAYSGLNHWTIALHVNQLLAVVQNQKRLYLLDRTYLDALRISCLDLQSPSLLWQRTIPNTKEGSMTYDLDSQALMVSAGKSGVWALKSRTGEILWKRPELYVKNKAIPSERHIVVFEPLVAGRSGAWSFLDSLTGKTILKNPHLINDVQEFFLNDSDSINSTNFLARIDAQNYAYLSHVDLSEQWTFHSDQKIKLTRFLGSDRYLVLYESNLLELRSLKDNALIWQKKLSLVNPAWMKISPDQTLITLPEAAQDEIPGVSIYNSEGGDYQVAARATEPVLDLMFFGDWVYLMSENHLWAFKK